MAPGDTATSLGRLALSLSSEASTPSQGGSITYPFFCWRENQPNRKLDPTLNRHPLLNLQSLRRRRLGSLKDRGQGGKLPCLHLDQMCFSVCILPGPGKNGPRHRQISPLFTPT